MILFFYFFSVTDCDHLLLRYILCNHDDVDDFIQTPLLTNDVIQTPLLTNDVVQTPLLTNDVIQTPLLTNDVVRFRGLRREVLHQGAPRGLVDGEREEERALTHLDWRLTP